MVIRLVGRRRCICRSLSKNFRHAPHGATYEAVRQGRDLIDSLIMYLHGDPLTAAHVFATPSTASSLVHIRRQSQSSAIGVSWRRCEAGFSWSVFTSGNISFRVTVEPAFYQHRLVRLDSTAAQLATVALGAGHREEATAEIGQAPRFASP